METKKTDQSSGENLCTSCNICCNGIMFGKVNITAPERERLRDRFGFEDETTNFRLGCSQLGKNGKCQCYVLRPQTCRDFKCALLMKVENEEVDIGTAEQIIADTKKVYWECFDNARAMGHVSTDASNDSWGALATTILNHAQSGDAGEEANLAFKSLLALSDTMCTNFFGKSPDQARA